MTFDRSALMARIRGQNTGPELALRKVLWRNGLRYQLHHRIEGARPDIVFPRSRVAVFIDGCFWHGCPEHYVRPRSKPDFWAHKLLSNVLRDRAQTVTLEQRGWTILRYWEHDVACRPEELAAEISQIVQSKGQRHRRPVAWVVVRVEALSVDGKLERWHLQDLRKPERIRIQERERSTRKW